MIRIARICAATVILPLSAHIECFEDPNILKMTPHLMEEIVSNPVRADGFGGQFQTIICSVIFAELSNGKFLYSPFKDMEHNYDNDPDFIKKKEGLINFIGNFEINDNEQIQLARSAREYVDFFENNLDICINSSSLKAIKKIFRANKKIENYFNPNEFNIAIHIRRPNPHDNRAAGTNTPDSIYINTIDALREVFSSKKPLFHIYSQGDIEKFENGFKADDIILHIDESIEQTFTSLVMADVLVTSGSSFSYTAGLISDGTVYYLPFWHPPLPHWIPIVDQKTRQMPPNKS